MEADVRGEDVEVGVGIVVAYGKAHPRTGYINPKCPRYGGEAHTLLCGVVAEEVHFVAVVGYPEVGIAVIVIVKEGDCVRLSGRLPYPIAQVVHARGVVTFVLLSCYRMFVDDRRAVGVCHSYLGAFYARILSDFGESEVPVVQVEQVVMPGMVVISEGSVVVVHKVADIDVEPAIVVDIRARDADCGAHVDGIAERWCRDVNEAAATVIEEQAVNVALLRRAEAESVVWVAPCTDIQVLVSVVVDVAGYYAGAVAVGCLDTCLRRDIGECSIARVEVQTIRLAASRSYIEVHVAIPVIIEDCYSGAVVPEVVVSVQCGFRDIGEGDDERERGDWFGAESIGRSGDGFHGRLSWCMCGLVNQALDVCASDDCPEEHGEE